MFFSFPHSIHTTPELDTLLHERNTVVVANVSGGPDSSFQAALVQQYLEAIGFPGKLVLAHADLGRMDWRDSKPTCERLAVRLDLPLYIEQWERGDLYDRFVQRWANNVERFKSMETILILMRVG